MAYVRSYGIDRGQIADYRDGNYHLQVYGDGSEVTHFDLIDPAISPIHALAHFLLETPEGFLIGLAIAARLK